MPITLLTTAAGILLTAGAWGASAAQEHHRFGLTQAMPRLDGTIRVASYNVLNYFDQVDDPDLQGEYDDVGDNPGPTSEARCRALADVIRAVDADLIALQEVESREALEHFNRTWLEGMGYNHIASEDVGYYRGCEQSLLSRFPIAATQIWPDSDLRTVERTGGGWEAIPPDARRDDFAFQRSPLMASVRTPEGYELALFIVHHKAGAHKWRREGEALRIVELVSAMQREDPDRNVLVLGDFNAQPWERSMQVYREGGMVDAMNLRRDVPGDAIEHGQASPLRVTHTSGRIIDFILLNHAAIGEFVAGSGFVLGTSAPEYDWRNDPIPPGYASDHYPVVIDLVPREGQGHAVTARPWPRDAMGAALAASPIETVSGNSPPRPVEPAGAGGFVASRRSGVFHKDGCANAARIARKNRTSYETAEAAKEAGKTPAKCCHR